MKIYRKLGHLETCKAQTTISHRPRSGVYCCVLGAGLAAPMLRLARSFGVLPKPAVVASNPLGGREALTKPWPCAGGNCSWDFACRCVCLRDATPASRPGPLDRAVPFRAAHLVPLNPTKEEAVR